MIQFIFWMGHFARTAGNSFELQGLCRKLQSNIATRLLLASLTTDAGLIGAGLLAKDRL